MIKYLILDMGKVLVYPTTGYWLFSPTFFKNIDVSAIDKQRVKDAMRNANSVFNGVVTSLSEEYKTLVEYYSIFFEGINYEIKKDDIELLAHDFTYNVNDNRYTLYDGVEAELRKLSKKYTILLLSDNWPGTEEYLKIHGISEYFSKMYISCNYGVTKGQGRLFDYPIRDFNIQKGEAMFVDDREDLLDIATQKGLDVMLMDRDKQVKKSKYRIINTLNEIEKYKFGYETIKECNTKDIDN